MSNFTERLTELIKTGNAYAVSGFLTEKTYAIRDLVVAAEKVYAEGNGPMNQLKEALDKLEEA